MTDRSFLESLFACHKVHSTDEIPAFSTLQALRNHCSRCMAKHSPDTEPTTLSRTPLMYQLCVSEWKCINPEASSATKTEGTTSPIPPNPTISTAPDIFGADPSAVPNAHVVSCSRSPPVSVAPKHLPGNPSGRPLEEARRSTGTWGESHANPEGSSGLKLMNSGMLGTVASSMAYGTPALPTISETRGLSSQHLSNRSLRAAPHESSAAFLVSNVKSQTCKAIDVAALKTSPTKDWEAYATANFHASGIPNVVNTHQHADIINPFLDALRQSCLHYWGTNPSVADRMKLIDHMTNACHVTTDHFYPFKESAAMQEWNGAQFIAAILPSVIMRLTSPDVLATGTLDQLSDTFNMCDPASGHHVLQLKLKLQYRLLAPISKRSRDQQASDDDIGSDDDESDESEHDGNDKNEKPKDQKKKKRSKRAKKKAKGRNDV